MQIYLVVAVHKNIIDVSCAESSSSIFAFYHQKDERFPLFLKDDPLLYAFTLESHACLFLLIDMML